MGDSEAPGLFTASNAKKWLVNISVPPSVMHTDLERAGAQGRQLALSGSLQRLVGQT